LIDSSRDILPTFVSRLFPYLPLEKTTQQQAKMSSTIEQVKKAVPKKGSIELFTPQYFAACTLGGILGE